MIRRFASLPAVCLFVPVLVASMPSSPAVPPTSRTVYVAVIDSKGAPITDLTAADFSLKEGGKDYEVKAELATGPMQIALVVDDNGMGVFRPSVAAFIQALLGKAEFEVVTVIDSVKRSTDFTNNADALRNAIGTLVQRQAARDGAVLLDGVYEAAKDLTKRKAERPVIVALTVGSTDKSSVRSGQLLGELKTNGALFHVVSLGNALVQSSSAGQANSDAINLGEGIDNGTKQSGGRRNQISAMTDVQSALQKVLDQITHQYALSYTLPDGVKMNERLEVKVKRAGATVLAPAKIADK